MESKLPLKIGIYGGTFDPIHIGHLNLAVDVTQYLQLDRLFLVPTNHNPLKERQPLFDATTRLKMIHESINPIVFAPYDNDPWKGNPEGYWTVDETEIHRPFGEPSYTFDTIKRIADSYHFGELHDVLNVSIFLIMGSDSISSIAQWHNVHEFHKYVTLAVVPRDNFNGYEYLELIKRKLNLEYEILPCPVPNISSSVIRNRIRLGQDISAFVPPPVVEEYNKMRTQEQINKTYRTYN